VLAVRNGEKVAGRAVVQLAVFRRRPVVDGGTRAAAIHTLPDALRLRSDGQNGDSIRRRALDNSILAQSLKPGIAVGNRQHERASAQEKE